MPISLNGSNGLTFNDQSVQNTAASSFGFKNRIINGAMVIDQRNAGAAITLTALSSGFPVDRMRVVNQTDGTFTAQQSSAAPAGFTNSVLLTVTATDTSIGAAQYAQFEQRVEGFNVADLGWGTANAQPIALSFWVRSSLTGTFCAAIYNSSGNRCYVATYTINSANTWENKSLTIAGDTSGTWQTGSSIGIDLIFALAVGSSSQQAAGSWGTTPFAIGTSGQTNFVGTNGATFNITGIQLERGSTATAFDYRPYGTELALCQRYFYVGPSSVYGYPSPNSGGYCAFQRYDYKVTMRAAATVVTAYSSQNNVSSIVASTRTADFFVDQIISSITTNTTWAVSYTASAEL
jgi:hypothetical protein